MEEGVAQARTLVREDSRITDESAKPASRPDKLAVTFFEDADAAEAEGFQFAVVMPRYQGKWVLCRHRERDTWEFPGGHREAGESPEAAAARELYEETGALIYELHPMGFYRTDGKWKSVGALFFAEIEEFGELPPFEIAEVAFMDDLPESWTYPGIHPPLLAHARGRYPWAFGESN